MLLSSQLSTEFPFTLPRGLIDAQRQVHRRGSVRLALSKMNFWYKVFLALGTIQLTNLC